MSELNDEVIKEFRAHAGVVREAMGGHFKDIHLLLLHHVGRRSGRTYVQPLLYVEDEDDLILVGSNGGVPEEPKWVNNVAGMSEVTIEVGDRTYHAKPTVLREGPERERLYAAVVDYWPAMLEYESNSDRVFPVIRLELVK
ncbi:nitroreductase/quinone reductase family protein [Streptomyces mirabilis]|uniref:nitroreductase/quinone reductase family protein n=1 Tax=Streptomyces mirabilis TaxID=68239 RepID=UPI0036AB93D6